MEAYDRALETNRQDEMERLALSDAALFYRLKQQRRCFTQLLANVKVERLNKQAAVYFEEGLRRRVFARLSTFYEQKRSAGLPNKVVVQFRKNHERSLLTTCLIWWRHHSNRKHQAK